MTRDLQFLIDVFKKEYADHKLRESKLTKVWEEAHPSRADSILDTIRDIEELNPNQILEDLKFSSYPALILMEKGCKIKADFYDGYFYLDGNIFPQEKGFLMGQSYLRAVNKDLINDNESAAGFSKGTLYKKEDKCFSIYYKDEDSLRSYERELQVKKSTT